MKKSVIIREYGIVQGVGFRPFVKRLADRYDITGSVCNFGPYVEIRACGDSEDLNRFSESIKTEAPDRASILKTEIREDTDPQQANDSFEIIESRKDEGLIFIPPDLAICDECSKELFDKNDRRYLHPFINCTQCGPRLTILESLPYDRERTGMKIFPMCRSCADEYGDKQTRRFDAQPICCNDCGPEFYIINTDGKRDGSTGTDAIAYVRGVIAEGGIVAIKGIGGFHLACDAANDEAVKKLRQRKNRPAKPFAVMMRDMSVVRRECNGLTERKEEILEGPQKPILLLEKNKGGKLSEHIAPDNPTVGVMLPYAPVQLLLFDLPIDNREYFPDMLVMTSGNIAGAPICRDEDEAVSELSGFVDCILSNDRPILTRADDSVMDHLDDRPYMIRRSRGYAPLPYLVDCGNAGNSTILAVGGELKNTFCIGKGDLFYPSSYIGDLSDERSEEVLEETIARFESMLECSPEIIVCDKHPGYRSTKIAEKLAKDTGARLIKLQHHYAHIVSCMAENDHKDPVIGISYDGTGYGDDGTVWGGEIFACDYREYERCGHIAGFLQAGGDISSKEGYRIAISMAELSGDKEFAESVKYLLSEEYGNPDTYIKTDEKSVDVIASMIRKNVNCIRSTSAGRLFDAVSAVLGIRSHSTFEGEAAMALEFFAGKYAEGTVEKQITEGSDGVIPTDKLFEYIVKERRKAVERYCNDRSALAENAERLAYEFHLMLARMTAEAAVRSGREKGIDTVALSGGCFQNRLFTTLVRDRIREAGMEVLLHSLIPPNDGGIALGQAVAARFMTEEV